MREVARTAIVARSRVSYLLQLTCLCPSIIRAILTGEIDASAGLRDLHAAADHLDWSLQSAPLTNHRHYVESASNDSSTEHFA
jgi:hypothetical protein